MKNILKTIVLIVIGILWLRVEGVSAADVTVNLTPETVTIGTFYNGSTVTISGQIPTAAEAVIRLSGEGEELHLKRKGKIGGLLWMNTDDLTFHNAPRVYKLLLPKGVEDLDRSEARDFGFAALKDRIEIVPAVSDNDFLLQEFVRLKKKNGLYSIITDSISYTTTENGMKSFEATLSIPVAMLPGAYAVEVAAVQDGKIGGTTEKMLNLKLVGFPEQLTAMAYGHALWYGIMSVVIAIMAGLFMGFLFKGGGGSH